MKFFMFLLENNFLYLKFKFFDKKKVVKRKKFNKKKMYN